MPKPTYEELVEALESMIDDFDDTGCDGCGTVSLAVKDAAEAVLKKATTRSWEEDCLQIVAEPFYGENTKKCLAGISTLHQLWKRAKEQDLTALTFVAGIVNVGSAGCKTAYKNLQEAVERMQRVLAAIQSCEEMVEEEDDPSVEGCYLLLSLLPLSDEW